MTANEMYQTKQENIARLIEQLQYILGGHSETQAKHQGNWGWVGDLTNVERQLSELISGFARVE